MLELGELFGWMLHANHIGKYADDQLVRLCFRRFFAAIPVTSLEKKDQSLHVISHALSFGGHTRLMERMATFEEKRPSLLVTHTSHIDYASAMPEVFSDIKYSDAEDSQSLLAMAHYCGTFQRVVVHISEYDFRTSVCLFIAKKICGARLFFVNHADHQFSFGREIADCILQISRIGIEWCSSKIPYVTSSFVGIPLDGKPATLNIPCTDGLFRVFLSGSSWRFRPMSGLSIVPHLSNLLSDVPNAQVIIIGPNLLRDYWWWPLKLRYGRRVRIFSFLPYAEYLKQLERASIVLDSFPMSGGTTLVESLWKGLWVYALASPHGGASPTDRLRRISLSSLRPSLLASADYRLELEACLRLLPEVHAASAVASRFRVALANGTVVPPDSLEKATDRNFLAKAWAAKGSITLRRALLGFREEASRVLVREICTKSFWKLTFLSKLLALRFLASTATTVRRRND